HVVEPSAAFPPLFTLVLAVPSAVGLQSFLAHRLWCCLVGALAVPLAAAMGRRLGGGRTGIVAAALTAVYPNLWMADALGMSETLSPVLVLAVLLLAYRVRDRRTSSAALWLGLMIGVAALGRDELALLCVLVLLPLTLARRMGPMRHRLQLLVVGGLAAAFAVAPVVAFNLSRFDRPVYISDGLGVTLASANCPLTYHGPTTGYWAMACAVAAPVDPRADESVQGAEAQSYAVAFIRHHAGDLPRLTFERLGRAFGFYHPLQQVHLDALLESRPRRWALSGLAMYYGLAALSVGGVVVLRRRRLPVFPLLAIGADVAVSVALTFGQTRYRSTFEVSLVLLAAVAVDAVFRRHAFSGRRPDRHDARRSEVAGADAFAAAQR
ncbi:MAG: glycosyltransferase family 39 protein, partial [Acidimicrobiales bacterium]